jgi:DNA ligase
MKEFYEKLQKYYDEIENEDVLKEVVSLFHSQKMNDIFYKLSHVTKDDKDFNDEYYLKLFKIILKLCNYIYNNTGYDTGISDSEYDELLSYYNSISNDESIITEKVNSNSTRNHRYKSLRGTLDKIYKITEEDIIKNKSQKTLDDWVKQTERRYKQITGDDIDLYNEEVIVMPKFDGVSCIFECDEYGNLQHALTRGDTERNIAQDITNIFKNSFKSLLVTEKYEYGLKTEIMIKNDKLKEYNERYGKDYKNTRSLVSAILNSDNFSEDDVEYLVVVPLRYSYMKDNGEESEQELAMEVFQYPFERCLLKETEKIHEFAFNHKNVFGQFRCDGCVIQLTNPKLQKILGRENERQKYEVAFKYTEEKAYSKVIDIEFTTGLFGKINPVVIFEPVKMKGNDIQRASLGSYSRFLDLGLAKGDIIKVLYDIIPYATYDDSDCNCTRSGNHHIKAPVKCEECGECLEVSNDNTTLQCVNPFCKCRIRGKIINYCIKMGIQSISYATVETLFSKGVLTSIEDLYKIEDKKDEIIKIPGFGINKVNNMISEINDNKEVTTSRLLGSIGIDGISTKKFETLLSYLSIDEVIEFSINGNENIFNSIPGIKSKTSQKIIEGIKNNIDLIRELQKILTIKEEDKKKYNYKLYFTKTRLDGSYKDNMLQKLIENTGGLVSDYFNKDIDVLVVPSTNTMSAKVEKAGKYEIPIVLKDDLEKYINDNYI